MQVALRHPEASHPFSSERLEIYASGYVERLADAAWESFPRLFRALGDEDFVAMMREFLRSHPSRVRNLNDFGEELPRFLADREGGWLADLARLEWAATQSFFAGPAPAPSPLADPSPGKWDTARVRLEASVIPLELTWSVTDLWEADQGETPPRRGHFGAVVYRRNETVVCEVLDILPTRILSRLYEGIPVGEAIIGWPGDRAGELQRHFTAWTERGWILGLDYA